MLNSFTADVGAHVLRTDHARNFEGRVKLEDADSSKALVTCNLPDDNICGEKTNRRIKLRRPSERVEF